MSDWQRVQQARDRLQRDHRASHLHAPGSSLPVGPVDRQRGRPVTPPIPLVALSAIGGGTGETCTLRGSSSGAGQLVTFTQTVGEQSWVADIDLPTTDIRPHYSDSYYDIQVEVISGGPVEVEVLRGDTVVWGPSQSPYWAGLNQVPVTAKGRLTRPAEDADA
jgi:hypothetical protein